MTTLAGDTVLAPATVVDALPAAPPVASLLSAGQALGLVVETDESHWGNGVVYLPEVCTPPTEQYWWDCVEGGGEDPGARAGAGFGLATKARETNLDMQRARAFDVWRAIGCSALQFEAEAWQARARRALVAHQSHQVEVEVWSGNVAQAAAFPNQYLLDTNGALLNSGVALGYRQALAELEQAVADAGGPAAMIHAQWRLASLWAADGLATPAPSGKYLRTALGTIIVPGTGYPGTGTGEGPTSPSAAASYAWVTPLVRVWLGPIRSYALEGSSTFDVDIDVNDITARVERSVTYTWDACLQKGVLVNLNTDHISAP